MDNAFRAWAQERIGEWQEQLGLYESGRIGATEMRNGKQVDTTQEAMADLRRWSNELSALLAEYPE